MRASRLCGAVAGARRRCTDRASSGHGGGGRARHAYRFSDPARFSLAHGGKDRHPYPVPLKVYDRTIEVHEVGCAQGKARPFRGTCGDQAPRRTSAPPGAACVWPFCRDVHRRASGSSRTSSAAAACSASSPSPPLRRATRRRARFEDRDLQRQRRQRQAAGPAALARAGGPDVVCLQELKAPQDKFPEAAIRDGRLRGDLARPEELERRRHPRARQASRSKRGAACPAIRRTRKAAISKRRSTACWSAASICPNGNPAPGPKFDYKLRWFERLIDARGRPARHRRARRAGRRLQRHADRPRRLQAGALAGRRAVPARGARRLSPAWSPRAGPMRCARCIRASASIPSGIISATPTPAMPGCASTTCCSAQPSPAAWQRPASIATCAAGRSPATTRRHGSSSPTPASRPERASA